LYSLLSNLRQWEERISAYDRFAWITIFGLPIEGWNRNCIDIIGYDTSCVSHGSISGIRALIRTTKLEPLHDQVILKLDRIQVEVSLKEIKGEFIPSLTIVKHFMDVSLYTSYMLSDDDEDDIYEETIRATPTHIATRQSVEFEYDFIGSLGNQNHIDSTFTKFVVSPLYLYPKITGLYRLATLSNERTYEVDNRLALILYDYVEVATSDCRAVDVQQVSCFSDEDGLDQQRGYSSGDLKKMGHKKKQKPSSMGPKANDNSTNIGPSFTNFVTPDIAATLKI